MPEVLSKVFTIGTPTYARAKRFLEDWQDFWRRSRDVQGDSMVKMIDCMLVIDKETEKLFAPELKEMEDKK